MEKRTYLKEGLNDNIRHKRVTYDDNGNVVKTEFEYYPEALYIKGKYYSKEKPGEEGFVPPLGANKKLYPSNKDASVDDTPSDDKFKNYMDSLSESTKTTKKVTINE